MASAMLRRLFSSGPIPDSCSGLVGSYSIRAATGACDACGALFPEVGLLDLRVRGDLFGRAFERHDAGLEHVSALGVLQGRVGVLLDQEHGRALAVDLLDR